MIRFPPIRWPAAVALLLTLMVVVGGMRSCGREPQQRPPVVAHTSAAAAAAQDSVMAKVLAQVMTERDGWRGKFQHAANELRGLKALRPDTVFHVDTVLLPDAFAGVRAIAPSGRADIRVYTRADSIGYRPSYYSVDVGKCDRGLVVGAEGVVCRVAPLGHLSLFVRGQLGADPLERFEPEVRGEVGLSWRRSFRSEQLVEVSVDQDRRVMAGLRLGVRLF